MRDEWYPVKKRWDKGRERRPRYAYASLNKRGEIVMNEIVWRVLKGTFNVTLLYDPEEKRIGVKFPAPGDRYAPFPVRKFGRGGKLRVVRARRLLRQFGIEVERTLVFNHPEVDRSYGVPMILLALEHTRER